MSMMRVYKELWGRFFFFFSFLSFAEELNGEKILSGNKFLSSSRV